MVRSIRSKIGCDFLSSRTCLISCRNWYGWSTRSCASCSGRSKTIAISIAPPSFWKRAGRPAWSFSRIETALFLHNVRSHSSRALRVRAAFWGGLVRVVVCPDTVQEVVGWAGSWEVLQSPTMQIPSRTRHIQCASSSRRHGRKQEKPLATPVRAIIATRPHPIPHWQWVTGMDTDHCAVLCSRARWPRPWTLCAVTMALLTNRLDLCIQGLFGAGKSKSMAVLLLALLELDDTENLKILFLCKENSGTRSFADQLLWFQPAGKSVRRIGRIVGDQGRNKSTYSQTRFDIHPRERKTMINKCQIVLATGGTVAQDLTMQWSAMGGFMQELLRRPHPGGPENHAVSAARSGNAAAGTVGMRRCCPIVVTPLVQWRSDIWVILLVIWSP